MNQIPGDVLKNIIDDPIEYKLVIAKHFLDKISLNIPKENSFEYFILETNIDAFLFFATNVIDIIKIEINNKFDLFDKENIFYIHGIRKKLDSHGVQKQIKDIIARYFSTPTYYEQLNTDTNFRSSIHNHGSIDVVNSSLWELQTLRNKAIHGKMLNITSKHKIRFDFTIRDPKNNRTAYQDIIDNPRKYFTSIFENLVQFVEQIRLLNPQKIQTSYYKQIDFRLE